MQVGAVVGLVSPGCSDCTHPVEALLFPPGGGRAGAGPACTGAGPACARGMLQRLCLSVLCSGLPGRGWGPGLVGLESPASDTPHLPPSLGALEGL